MKKKKRSGEKLAGLWSVAEILVEVITDCQELNEFV